MVVPMGAVPALHPPPSLHGHECNSGNCTGNSNGVLVPACARVVVCVRGGAWPHTRQHAPVR